MNPTDNDKWIQWIEDGISKSYINYYEYNELENIKFIDSGGFGVVHKANLDNSNVVVALKSFRSDHRAMKEVVNEVNNENVTVHSVSSTERFPKTLAEFYYIKPNFWKSVL